MLNIHRVEEITADNVLDEMSKKKTIEIYVINLSVK